MKTLKKLSLIFVSIILLTNITYSQNVAINDDGTAPENSAILDINTTAGDKGLLIPRIDLDDASTASPITSPAEGLMIYNETGTEPHGLYYWDGSEWINFSSASGGSGLWTRNEGNGYTYLTFGNDKVGIGISSPNEQLQITGNFRMPTTTATTGIFFVDGNRFLHNFGTDNVFLGKDAGNLTNSGGTNNIGIGMNALSSLTNGDYNIAIGDEALFSHTGASGQNIAIGYQAGKNITTGYGNVSIGHNADWSQQGGIQNVVIGRYAGANIGVHTKSYNVLIGGGSGFSVSGYYNVCLGASAGRNATTETVAIGYQAGYNIKEGSVMIGNKAGYNDFGANKLYIENSNSATPLIYGEFDNDKFQINASILVPIDEKTADYTVTTSDGLYTIKASNSSDASTTITLPTAASSTNRILIIKNTDAESDDVIIDGNSAETIDGATTQTLSNQYDKLIIQCDGTEWFIIGD